MSGGIDSQLRTTKRARGVGGICRRVSRVGDLGGVTGGVPGGVVGAVAGGAVADVAGGASVLESAEILSRGEVFPACEMFGSVVGSAGAIVQK